MDWDLDDSRSIYPQLKELIKRGIITGEYAPGSAFPTVRELASDAGVNRIPCSARWRNWRAKGF